MPGVVYNKDRSLKQKCRGTPINLSMQIKPSEAANREIMSGFRTMRLTDHPANP